MNGETPDFADRITAEVQFIAGLGTSALEEI